MSGTISATLTEAAGSPAQPADIDRTCIVIGCSSLGSGLSAFYSSTSAAVAGRGYGDAVDTLCQGIAQRQDGQAGITYPGAMYTVPGSTPGSYGTIDVSGVTGTALVSVDSATLPYGTYEAWLKVITGFTVGTTGGAVQWSLDGGRNWSNTIALGTADSYLITTGNVKFLFNPAAADVTAIHTLVNEEFTDANAHFILVTGTVHTNSSVADVLSAGTYPSATNQATTVARVNAMRTALISHFGKGSGASPAIHINVPGDAAGAATLTATPVATDYESAMVLALVIKTVLNTHDASTVFHTIADATNTISSPAPAAGTLATGDLVKARTLAPAPSASDIDAAFTFLSTSSGNMGLIALDFPITAALLAHVTTGITAMTTARGKRPTVIARSRLPNWETSETETTWLAAVAADMVNFNDSRIHVRTTYGLITDATTTHQYLRSDLSQFVADAIRVERYVWPGAPADQAVPNFILVNSSGTLVGHDEGTGGAVTGLSNDVLGNRFGCQQRLPNSVAPESVYNTVPWTMFGPTDRIKNFPTRRVCNAIERAAVTIAQSQLGAVLGYVKANPSIPGSQPRLTPNSLRAIQAVLFQALSTAFARDIQNASDGNIKTGLVQVDPVVVVTGGNLIAVSVTLAPMVLGYLQTLNLTLAVQE